MKVACCQKTKFCSQFLTGFIFLRASIFFILTTFYSVYAFAKFSDEVYQSDPVILKSEGERLYDQNCAICHGSNGEGRIGPVINYTISKGNEIPVEDFYQITVNGNDAMPAFKRLLPAQDIETIMQFIRKNFYADEPAN